MLETACAAQQTTLSLEGPVTLSDYVRRFDIFVQSLSRHISGSHQQIQQCSPHYIDQGAKTVKAAKAKTELDYLKLLTLRC